MEVVPGVADPRGVLITEGLLDVLGPAFGPQAGRLAFGPGGTRFTFLMRSRTTRSLPSVEALRLAWAELRQTAGQRGPLQDEVEEAGASRGEERLQRALTLQLEEAERTQLHSAFMALPRTDTRRQAWVSAGRGSSQWVTAAPSERYDLGDHGGLVLSLIHI